MSVSSLQPDGSANADTLNGLPFSLEDIVTTEQLTSRPVRPADYAAENSAIVDLAHRLTELPETLLQGLAEAVLVLCTAGSAGVSIAERCDEADIFRWHAAAGCFAPYIHGTLPRGFSPCGTVLDRNAMLLMAEPQRFFPYIHDLSPSITEVLLVPFYRAGIAIGTVWVVSHTPQKRFDAEDARIVKSLSQFAAAAADVLATRDGLTAANRELRARELDQQRAAAEMAEIKARLDSALQAAEIGTWTYNLLSDRVVADRNVARMFGVSGADAAGGRFHSYLAAIHPADRDRVSAQIKAAIASGESFEAEYRLVSPENEVRWVISRGRVERDACGRTIALPGVIVDITSRKLVEEELHQATASAESANRAKDRFLAVLSHELRTPLSPVVMAIPAIEADPDLPHKFREELAMVRRNIDLEVKLIDDLLDLSRITNGKIRLKVDAVNVHEVLRHAIQNIEGDTAAKRLGIRQELTAENITIAADATRLQQVFWNLLRNAAKFTPEGGTIHIRTWNDGPQRLSIEVADSGVGIAPEVLSRIFEAFDQGEAGTTHQFGGLGLGLAIAKALIEMHGGSIRATSKGRGQGSAFTLELPVGSASSQKIDVKVIASLSMPMTSGRSRVLLVEDHADTANVLSRLLRSEGFEVTTAGNVAVALQLAEAQPFDVVVSDIGLPDATGYELMRQIKNRHGTAGVALSGYGMEEDVRKGHDAGFVEHVVKPVNIAELAAVLRRVTARDRSISAASAEPDTAEE